MSVRALPWGVADCDRPSTQDIPAPAVVERDGERLCLPHFLAELPTNPED